MKKREFNKILKTCLTKKVLDRHKLNDLSEPVKNCMIDFIVKNRMPIVSQLLNDTTDINRLHACGYLNIVRGKNDFVFLCTCENALIVKN